ncbi:OspG family effector kinase [Pseudomonas sp. SDO524_S393]
MAPENDESLDPLSGFDPAHARFRGKPASAVIDGLTRHLIDTGKATPSTANLAASRLLARTAPAFLLRDIPPSITFGSIGWVQLAIATARVEADAPGSSSTMSYAEVMAAAQGKGSTADVQLAQRAALAQWGVLNGWLKTTDGPPGEAEMDHVRNLYNDQVRALTAAGDGLDVQLPSRRDMALTMLQQAFPAMEPSLFEAKALQKVWLNPGRPGVFPGLYSMLDIVMDGAALKNLEHWVSRDTRIPAKQFCTRYEAGKLNAAAEFKAAYDQAITSLEKGHAGLAKYLISTLAPEDRADFEFGELEFFHTNDYTIALDFFTPPALRVRGETLRIKTTRAGKVNVYELDTRSGTLKKQNFLISRYTPPYTQKNLESRNANVLSRTVLIDPLKDEQPGQNQERLQPKGALPGDLSGRIDYIGKVFAKSLDLRNDDLLAQARGASGFDDDRATDKAIGEFFLNLIPLRSAIVNFSEGRYAEGAFDLALDVVGLVTFGAGKAAQAGRAFSKGVGSLGGLARVARFVGASTLEAFNPLSGLGDTLASGVSLLHKSVRKGLSAGLDNAVHGAYKVSESNIAGLTRNSQGIYLSADGQVSHIRNTDSTGRSAVYEVRQVSRTEDGAVQARVYHNNRQTELLVQHVQGDQWQRVVARGGNPPSVLADLGEKIGGGAEGTIYASLDGKSVYKDFGTKAATSVPDYVTSETRCLNLYYGEGFAEAIVEEGRAYIRMKRLDGVSLESVSERSLPSEVQILLDEALAGMEAKGIYHSDMHLNNFLYSARDKKVYPVDIQAMDPEVLAGDPFLRQMAVGDYQRSKARLQAEVRALIVRQ